MRTENKSMALKIQNKHSRSAYQRARYLTLETVACFCGGKYKAKKRRLSHCKTKRHIRELSRVRWGLYSMAEEEEY
jgi:hypothetical protein